MTICDNQHDAATNIVPKPNFLRDAVPSKALAGYGLPSVGGLPCAASGPGPFGLRGILAMIGYGGGCGGDVPSVRQAEAFKIASGPFRRRLPKRIR